MLLGGIGFILLLLWVGKLKFDLYDVERERDAYLHELQSRGQR